MSIKADGEAKAMIPFVRFAIKAMLMTLASIICAPLLHSADGGEPSFTVKITAQHSTVRVGESSKIMVELTNRSSGTILVHSESGRAEWVYNLIVRDADNNTPEKTPYYRRVSGEPAGPDDTLSVSNTNEFNWQVGPGETSSDYADLSKLYNMPPGMYTVQMERLDPATKKIVKSNTITITVIP